MTIIRTIKGDISPDQLGATNMHDHLNREPGTVEVLHDKDFLMNDPQKAAEELADFRDFGGGGFLDAQPIGCGRNITKYLQIADAVPEVPIIATTGFHKSEFYLPIGVRVGKVIVGKKSSWNIYGEYQTSLIYDDWSGSAVENSFRINVTYTLPVGL